MVSIVKQEPRNISSLPAGSSEEAKICDTLARRVQLAKMASLVSALVFAVILLTFVLVLAIPGAPVLYSLVLGASLLVTGVATILFICAYIRSVRVLLNCFSKETQVLAKSLKNMSKKLSKIQVQDFLSAPVAYEKLPPPIPLKKTVTKPTGEEEELCKNLLAHLTGEFSKIQQGGSETSALLSAKEQKIADEAARKFSVICEGIEFLVKRLHNGEPVLTAAECSKMFLWCNPFSHPLLKITRNMRLLFGGDDGGAWLCSAIQDPVSVARPLLRLLELVKGNEGNPTRHQGLLIGINLLLTGWCLNNPDWNQRLLQSIKTSVSSDKQEQVVKMLSSGNILGALSLVLYSGAPNILIVQEQPASKLPFEEIDPGRVCRASTQLSQLLQKADREKTDKGYAQGCDAVFAEMGFVLPSGRLSLVRQVVSRNSKLLGGLAKARQFFVEHPPFQVEKVVAFLSSLRKATPLQSRIKGYIFAEELEAFGSLLSNLILGAYIRGVLSHNQLEELRYILDLTSNDQLEEIIRQKQLVKNCLPALF